jgi:hypothetical protein
MVTFCIYTVPCHAAESNTNVSVSQVAGAWQDAGATNNRSLQRITVFNLDGTYTESVTLRSKNKSKQEKITGMWKLDGTTLEMITVSSSNMDIEKPGEVTKLKVIKITPDTLVIQYDDGETETLARVKKETKTTSRGDSRPVEAREEPQK